MKFVKAFFISALVTSIIYYAVALLIIAAPIRAEYWVAEMITIKKQIADSFAGHRKIILAGGSSTLFGIDAEYASRKLGIPVINFGLHAGLRLKKVLQEAGSVTESGDTIVLALEPKYYKCNDKLDSWQVTQTIGWDHNTWKEMDSLNKAEFLSMVTPTLFGQMIFAELEKKLDPSLLDYRLEAFDDSLVLSKFRARKIPSSFDYSAYNLDDHGDMQGAETSKYYGPGEDAVTPQHVCSSSAAILSGFVADMEKKGVRVYFANTPYIASQDGLVAAKKSEPAFLAELAPIGCMIDKREDIFFERKYFFNTRLHLNSSGRAIRTDQLIKSIQDNVLQGGCQQGRQRATVNKG